MEDGMQEVTSGAIYAKAILEKWLEIGDLRERFTYNYLMKEPNQKIVKEYVSKLISLYKEVLPKVKDHPTFDKDTVRIAKFSAHSYDPMLLIEGREKKAGEEETKNYKLVFELDELLRDIMEKLKITAW